MIRLIVITIGIAALLLGMRGLTREISNMVNLKSNIEESLK